ncbi:TolC family protein [Kaistella sp. G5-32]|uniref:TolC family protein n=1 Tax=Kaistella gelatinilytica TaxID=2787636 RepID=A0ABS0FCH5_9FLAO|nr:TolC family protein [Kaistella gelatinilytica]MBF8457337.1 TolC family protein [Kaistella gelatinilytica]
MNRLIFLGLLISSGAFAQQKIAINEAEEAFVKNNLQLLAQQYNISIADADIIQAKIWNLPEASFQANVYNPEDKKIFDVGPSKSFAVQQLFLLGGKRKNEVEFAKSNKELAQLQLKQLLVDLKTKLRETFYSIYFDQKKLVNIDKQLNFLTDLVKAYKVQTAKGNIALKDEVRLQAIVLDLNNEKLQIRNSISSQLQDLHTLTGISGEIAPEVNDDEADTTIRKQTLNSLDEIKQKALENNADYLYVQKAVESSKSYYNWQKSLNIPDVTGGLQWNQSNGIFKNEVNFTVGIPIPLWKQNEGNVQKAKTLIDQSQKNSEFKKLEVESNVTAAYQTWQNNYDAYFNIQQKDLNNLEAVYKGMQDNFRKGNVTLIDFTDFTNSYKETVLKINEMQKQIVISAEELNQLVQTPIFN